MGAQIVAPRPSVQYFRAAFRPGSEEVDPQERVCTSSSMMGSRLAFGMSARSLKEAIRTCQLTSLPKPVTSSWIPGGRRLDDETNNNR